MTADGVGHAEPTLLCEGAPFDLAGLAGARLASIVMPVKDAGPGLEALLSAIRRQRWAGRAELVAVDSGSTDSTVATLRDFGATVLTIDPGEFDHGLTRSAASRHARGELLVFVTQSMRPVGDQWLGPLVETLDGDPQLAGVSSRLVPHEDADPLIRLDGLREASYSTMPSRRAIEDREHYGSLSPAELRTFAHFHTVSCAIRPEALARVPFRSVTTIGEDLQWGKDALEAGLAIAHEPRSVARHSHDYRFDELLGRSFDDGVAAREIVGSRLCVESLLGHIAAQVDADLTHLRGEYELGPEELEHWERESISRRTAQLVGQWLGTNADQLPAQAVPALSLARRRARPLGMQSTGRPALDAIVRYAAARSPYYRELLARRERFEDIPPLTKALVRANFERIVVPGLPAARMQRTWTSGSTGEPTEFISDADAAHESLRARAWLLELSAIPRDATIVWVALDPRHELPPNWSSVRMRDITRANLAERLAGLDRLEGYILYGIASSLEWIATEVERSPGVLPGMLPLAVVTSADTLTSVGRRRIERVFGCPVHSWYGSIETDPSLAGTAPGESERYVVNEERCHIEVTDEHGRPCAPGERGQILVTDLHNRCFPLLRYALADLATASDRTYRGNTTLQRIEGRTSTLVELDSGAHLTESTVSLAVLRATSAVDLIDGFQCAQTGPNALEMRVVWREKPDRDAANELEAACRYMWGDRTEVRVRAVEQLEVLPSGKRWVLKRLDS